METLLTEKQSQTVNWKQIGSLAFLNAAVVISWIAYHNYQPKVLEKFQVQHLHLFLLIAQAVILVSIPPLAGWVGDYVIKKNGNRFVVFTVGIGITAMVFMAVAFSLTGNTLGTLRFIVPALIVIWLVSMNIFHSPANSMLELFAPSSQLPLAMSILAMTTELLYALEPIIIIIVDFLGASITFGFGAFLMVLSGWLFLTTTKNVKVFKDDRSEETGNYDNFVLILFIGSALGLITAVIMNLLPHVLSHKLSEFDNMSFGGKHFASLILAMAAILSLPLSKVVDSIGFRHSLLLGLLQAVIAIIGIYYFDNEILVIASMIVLAEAFSLCSVSAFPFVLQNVSARQVTFGAGIFFGCNELADGLMNIFL